MPLIEEIFPEDEGNTENAVIFPRKIDIVDHVESVEDISKATAEVEGENGVNSKEETWTDKHEGIITIRSYI